MKRLLLLAIPGLMLAVSCTKEFEEEVKKPGKNSWFVNDKTYSCLTFRYDTSNLMSSSPALTELKGGMLVKFSKRPTTDGTFTIRKKADEVDEIAITVLDTTDKLNPVIYTSMDDDGMKIKKDQFARVSVNGSVISVSFEQVWLKNEKNNEQAKVSANLVRE